ncbi:MAG: hypothetical protein V4603_14020 [Pseudomonadota bacterium]
MMLLLRQFFTPFNGSPLQAYIGFALLAVLIMIGFFYPRLAFGIAVWDYVLLFAVPFSLAPKVLRSLICNRRLLLVPGFAQRAVLAALIFTLMQSSFLSALGWLYGIPTTHLRNAVQLFVISSAYLALMQYAVTTRIAIAILSLFPLVFVGSFLFFTLGSGQYLLGDDHVLWLLIATLLGWGLGWWRSGRDQQFRPEHVSLEIYKGSTYQRAPMPQWLLTGSNALAAPDATLLLGYPATLVTRACVLLFMFFFGPGVAALLLGLLDFGADWSYQPGTLDIFLGASLFPATFGSYQTVEWVARLRLLWLRRRMQRDELWQLLEKQLAINTGLMLLIACALMLTGMQFSGLEDSLLLHYPLLVLTFNAFYAYYIVLARASVWPQYAGLLLSFVGSGLVFNGVLVAVRSDSTVLLYVIEAVTLTAAVCFRFFARRKLLGVDWLLVKPLLPLGQRGSNP